MQRVIEYLNNNKKIVKIIICLSCPFLALLLSFDISKYDYPAAGACVILSCILAFISSIYFIKHYVKIEKIELKKLIYSILISAYSLSQLLRFTKEKIYFIINDIGNPFKITNRISKIDNIIAILAFPFLIFIVYWFIENILPKAIDFFKTLTKSEKKYIKCYTLIYAILLIILTYTTTAFSACIDNNGSTQIYDVIYTSDTPYLYNNDVFINVFNIENDIRQPLFGIFAFPFGILAKFASQFLFMFPQHLSYGYSISIIQVLLLAVTNILLSRMLKLSEKDKSIFYIFVSISFPYLLFSIVIEQYVIALFYLILAFYSYFEKKEEINYYYIGATGTLLTSGIIFPVISNVKKIEDKIKNILKCFFMTIYIFLCSGQFTQFIYMTLRLEWLDTFVGNVSFTEKFAKFTNFVRTIFVSYGGIIENNGGFYRYALADTSTISILGCIILVIALISVIINRKNKIANVSFLWVLFSFCVLCLKGWGIKENGLILYSLYFAWAYLILFYLFIKKIIKNEKIFKYIMVPTIIIMSLLGIKEFLNIILFAIRYY